MMMRPEIVAPAGNDAMLKAAIENGADAVYFGLQDFNARLRADNFRSENLAPLMRRLHERGVKGYVTLNTLIFPAETERALNLFKTCSDAGVDGVMVQDLGMAFLASRMFPELPIFASTQMSLTSAESIRAAKNLGINIRRVVLAREIPLPQLEQIRKATDTELEIFVHGALCISYSGQCLASMILEGRSANRGVCAQPCRQPYKLVVDGKVLDLGEFKYPLSPKDLCAYEDLPRIMSVPIEALKIEGRLKTPEYAAAAVRIYREAIDKIMESGGGETLPMENAARLLLEQVFSRGFTKGYLHGIDHQAVVEGRFPKKRGVYLGRVKAVSRNGVALKLEAPLKKGDGVVFDAGAPEAGEEGGKVYDIQPCGRARDAVFNITFGAGDVDFSRVHIGDRVWKTSDPQIESELRASFAGDKIRYQRPLSAEVRGESGQPLTLILRDWEGFEVKVADTAPAESASHQPLTHETLFKQLGRLGNTPFCLVELKCELKGGLMVPFSRLNDLRRRAVEALLEKRRRIGLGRASHPEALAEIRNALGQQRTPKQTEPEFHLSVLCRTMEQVRAAIKEKAVEAVYGDFAEWKDFEKARSLLQSSSIRFIPATPVIYKPGEERLIKRLAALEPDAALIRNLASLDILRREKPDLQFIADYSLNVANEFTAFALHECGFGMMAPAMDLQTDQICDLMNAAPPDWFEVVFYFHVPLFTMEHCLFRRFVENGADCAGCGKPCRRSSMGLQDHWGDIHAVRTDAGGRTIIYESRSIKWTDDWRRLADAGARHFRIEFVDENEKKARGVLAEYISLAKQPRGFVHRVLPDTWRYPPV